MTGRGGEPGRRALHVGRTVVPAEELDWRFSGSGGPGGQHANTANTRVELRFDVAACTRLGPRQKARLVDRLGPVVRVVVSEERSQLRNREIALRRLEQRLADALRIERARRETRPTGGSVERRLRDKRERGERKRARMPPGEE